MPVLNELNTPVNNVSVILGWSHHFLGINQLGSSCNLLRTKHDAPCGDQTQDFIVNKHTNTESWRFIVCYPLSMNVQPTSTLTPLVTEMYVDR